MKQAPWLSLARRQAGRLAESMERDGVPPLQWPLAARRTTPARSALARHSWAAIVLPLLVLGGATGTWAYVAHLKQQRREAAAKAAAGATPPAKATRQRQRRAPAPRVVRPEPATTGTPQASRASVPAETRRSGARRGRRSATARPVAAKQTPRAERAGSIAPTDEPQRVIFGTSDAPAEPAIIVSPPAKLGPLWTPEAYKRRGMPRSGL